MGYKYGFTLVSSILLFALLACGNFLGQTEQNNESAQTPTETQEIPTTQVIVALQPIKQGSKFLAGFIGRRDWPVNNVPPDIITDEAEAGSKVAKIDIEEGQVIVRSMLADPNITPVSTAEKPLPAEQNDEQDNANVSMQEVIIALQPISRGSEFLVGSIGRKKWPADDVPSDAIVDEAETIARVAKKDIAEGQIIVRSMLADPVVLTPVSTRQVIVALQPISKGDEFTFGSLERQNWPTDKIPTDVIVDEAETIGKITIVDVAKGQPILRSMLVDSIYRETILSPPFVQTPMSASELSLLPGKIAFVSGVDGGPNIYVMSPDSADQLPLVNDPVSSEWPVWSPDGKLLVFASERDGNSEIYVMNSDGTNQTRLTENQAHDMYPTWSPDGKYIAFVSWRDESSGEIYVMNNDGTNQSRLTNNAFMDTQPAWSPDGEHIAFAGRRNDNVDIYIMDVDGTNETRLTENEGVDWMPAWSPDGKYIAFVLGSKFTTDSIYVMESNGTNVTRLTHSGAFDLYPTWSFDGKYIAFVSLRDGHQEIYVMNSDGTNQTRLTNNGAENWSPAWSP